MKNFLNEVEISFKSAMNGSESINNLIWRWGVAGYVITYFILDKIVKISSFRSIDILVSLLASFYFAWHIYVLRKCSPKKPKLTKEEKQKLKEQARKELGGKFMRKLLLKEPINNWDPAFITIIIDIFCITNFLDYVFR